MPRFAEIRDPDGRARARRRWLWALGILGAWIAWGLLWSVTFDGSASLRGETPNFWEIFRGQMPQALAWAAVTPLILWLGRKFPFERGRWPVSLLVHVVACAVVLLSIDSMYIALSRLMATSSPSDYPTFPRQVATAFVYWFSYDGLLYWMVLALGHTARHYRKARERELEESVLQRQLAEARLRALNTQLHPHFLFNALNTIGMLVRTGEGPDAVRVLARLGELLRRVLDEAAVPEVPLRQEVEFVNSYLEIERARFGDRLRVTIDVDPAVLEARVPHLLLQPLVENAIRHGVAAKMDAGRVEIEAGRRDGTLWLRVGDDGPGLEPGEAEGARGVGLLNTRERLAQLYPGRFTLEVGTGNRGGAEVRIGIPYRETAQEPEAE